MKVMTKIIFNILLMGILISPLSAAEKIDFTLKDLNGKTHKLSDYRGKWVVLNYWATWCPPCREEMPDLDDFHQQHKDKDAVVLGLNLETVSDEKLKEFVDEYFISFPIFKLGENSIPGLPRIQGLPTSFIITPKGDLVVHQTGSVTKEAIENFIDNYKE